MHQLPMTDPQTDVPLTEYPRPQLKRVGEQILNGRWDYAITSFDRHDPLAVPDPAAAPPDWDGTILVPFSPEVPLSGVERLLQPNEILWYHRTFELTPAPEMRVILHFGAVDQSCRVSINGVEVGQHTGGYLPFSFDITEALGTRRSHEVVVAVRDVTDTSWLSRGKQRLNRGGIWYSAQSGIWQTVWLEQLPLIAVDSLELSPNLEQGTVAIKVGSANASPDALAKVSVLAEGTTLLTAELPVGELHHLEIPGPICVWHPDTPFLYDVRISLGSDRVESYFGMRSFGTGHDGLGRPCLLLNGKPHLPIGLLDQGYWPDGGYTAPTDEALRSDIELAKSMGFNMLRKHIKVEPLRWYHHCDQLGMLVWQDHVNGGTTYRDLVVTAPAIASPKLSDRRHSWFGRSAEVGREQSLAELASMVELLRDVPSIALWVPFNEAWGQFDATSTTQLLRRLDPTRPVDHASGWHDQGAGDLDSRHIYFQQIRRDAWGRDQRVPALSEYGGYGLPVPGHLWGSKIFGTYKKFDSAEQLMTAFDHLVDAQIVPSVADGLAALVYTQLSDVEDEINGLVTYDRAVVKLPVERVRAANERIAEAFASDSPTERELNTPVSLTDGIGRFNPAAHGWARDSLVDTSGIDGRTRWGRNKRWEYWNVITETHIVALTVSSLDFVSVNEIWIYDKATGQSWGETATGLGSRGIRLPANLESGSSTAKVGGLRITVEEVPEGTRLRADLPDAGFDIVAHRVAGQERLAVVVPWTDWLFQYTVKDIARPASGTIRVGDQTVQVSAENSWAVLDHGRGRWPHDVRWNWGAGAGILPDGRSFGLQIGGQWTVGTGSTENAVLLAGRLHKISEQVSWEYDLSNWRSPWRVSGGGLAAQLKPFFNKQSASNLGVLSSRTDQVFGTWSGTFDTGNEVIEFSGVEGFGEDVHNRW